MKHADRPTGLRWLPIRWCHLFGLNSAREQRVCAHRVPVRLIFGAERDHGWLWQCRMCGLYSKNRTAPYRRTYGAPP